MGTVMRRGREFYAKTYEQAVAMHAHGVPVKDIGHALGISYSCAYHWVNKLRTPEQGRLAAFEVFLETNGPTPAIDIKEHFPKHNELFLTASKRGLRVKRLVLTKKLGDYATWYFHEGQEDELHVRVQELFAKVKELGKKLAGEK